MKDNINNEIHIGDSVFCYSGSLKNTIQTVAGFRIVKEDFSEREAVNFENGFWLSANNVISLSALGADVSEFDNISKSSQCDALGHPLHIGDKVLYLHSLEMYTEVGIVKSLAAKSCLLTIQSKRFRKDEYRKKYEELISLSALNIDCIPERNILGEIIG